MTKTPNTDALLPDEAHKKLLEFTELSAVKIEAGNVYESISMQTMHNDRLARAFPSLLALASYYAVKANTRTPKPSVTSEDFMDIAVHVMDAIRCLPTNTTIEEQTELLGKYMHQAILTAFHVSRKE